MTNQNNLLLWIYDRYPDRPFKTSAIKEYAYKYPTNRADRDKRILCEKGLLRRIHDDREKESWGYFGGKEDMYMITDLGKKEVKGLGQMQLF